MAKAFKYYYDLMSQPSRAIYITLRMNKINFEGCPVAIRKSEQLSDEFKKINRFRKVPCIVDGDVHLGESVAIIRYLFEKYKFGEQLYPSDIMDRARVDEFLSWQHLSLRYPLTMYFVRLWALPMRGMAHPPSEEQQAIMRKEVDNSLKTMENIWLKDSSFVTGSKITIADLFGACEVEQLKATKYDVSKFPRLTDWLARTREESNPHYDEAHVFINKVADAKPKK